MVCALQRRAVLILPLLLGAIATGLDVYLAATTGGISRTASTATLLNGNDSNDSNDSNESRGPHDEHDKVPSRTKSCVSLNDTHGTWIGSTSPGGVYVLTCESGYQVDGNTTVSLVCSDTEQWPANPWCETVDDCDSLVYGCGPAGICEDEVSSYQCLCEHGAIKRKTSNGEDVCYFEGDGMADCGGRNCGAHGVCINLNQYQNTFDTGSSSFRCSCERGWVDDGATCAEANCGELEDPLGKWSGSQSYLGEYTLDCDPGAFVWGGSEQATTISCPAIGLWSNPPRCQSPEQEAENARSKTLRFWLNVAAVLICIVMAAIAAGLTMGLLSLEPRELEIILAARPEDCSSSQERDKLLKQKDAATKILPLLKDHHLLLVTLLLLNALANESLPIFLDELVPPFAAVLLAVTFVLICGEIIPSAVFTGPLQLTVASMGIPCVNFLLVTLYAVAKPIAMLLDKGMGHAPAHDSLHSRPELRAVIRLHSTSGVCDLASKLPVPEHSSPSPLVSGPSRSTLLRARSEDTTDLELSPDVRSSSTPAAEASAPLHDLEADLCLGSFLLGDTTVADCPGMYSIRRCSKKVFAADVSMRAAVAALQAAQVAAEVVVVFKSLELVQWPVDVPTDDLLGVIRLSELLSDPGDPTLETLCDRRHHVATLQADEAAADALVRIADTCGTPCGFGVVLRRGEFFGLLDGEEATTAVLFQDEWLHSQPSLPSLPSTSHRSLLRSARVESPIRSRQEQERASRCLSPQSPVPSSEAEAFLALAEVLAEVAAAAVSEPFTPVKEAVDESEAIPICRPSNRKPGRCMTEPSPTRPTAASKFGMDLGMDEPNQAGSASALQSESAQTAGSHAATVTGMQEAVPHVHGAMETLSGEACELVGEAVCEAEDAGVSPRRLEETAEVSKVLDCSHSVATVEVHPEGTVLPPQGLQASVSFASQPD